MRSLKWLVLLLSLTAVSCARGTEQPSNADPVAAGASADSAVTDPGLVRVDPAMLRDLRITVAAVESRRDRDETRLLGELAVDERAYAIVGAPIAARASRLLVALGDPVQAEQALVELQSPELGRARSVYISARARSNLAEQAVERKRDLATERIVPQREVQEAETDAMEARAALRSATASLTALGVTPPGEDDGDASGASTFVLRSPVRGTVIERAVVLGQMLDPSIPAFRIADLSTLWLTVRAFERDAVRIMAGAAATLTFPALPGQEFQGAVSLVGREVEHESRTVPIRIDVRNTGGLLRPGMSATAAVPIGTADQPILTVPVAAVQRLRNEWCVFVPRSEGAFEVRMIGRGRDLGGEVEVLSGLQAGESVVVDGAFLLRSQAEQREAGHEGH